MVCMQGTSDPNPELLDAMAMCGHLVGRDSVHWFLAEHRQRLFPDDMFADLFSSGRGRPSVPADVVATVMVLQALVEVPRPDGRVGCGDHAALPWRSATR